MYSEYFWCILGTHSIYTKNTSVIPEYVSAGYGIYHKSKISSFGRTSTVKCWEMFRIFSGGRIGSVVTRRDIVLKIRGSSPANGSSRIAG